MVSVRQNLENLMFFDITVLMSKIDAVRVLERLGIDIITIEKRGDEVTTFCPDHHLFVGRESSDPNWGLNLKTGKCKCLTEPRGSNFVFTVARIRGCSPKEAAEWMLEQEEGASADLKLLMAKGMSDLPDDLRSVDESGVFNAIEGLLSIKEESEKGYLSNSVIDFFIHPPEKKLPTNIRQETLRHFKVFERTWGYYNDRAIIPYFFKGSIQGFAALDKNGKKKWLKKNPLRTEKDYKKVLFPKGIKVGSLLFGYDNVKKGCPLLVITEGPREVMKLWQEGYPNSVALSGTNLTGEHLELIAEIYPRSIMIFLDGDDAGVRATEKIAQKMVDTFAVFSVNTPDGKDPKVLEVNDLRFLFRNAKKVKKWLK